MDLIQRTPLFITCTTYYQNITLLLWPGLGINIWNVYRHTFFSFTIWMWCIIFQLYNLLFHMPDKDNFCMKISFLSGLCKFLFHYHYFVTYFSFINKSQSYNPWWHHWTTMFCTIHEQVYVHWVTPVQF